jgi:trans-AT polyketide synthase/acyltransferase/oxidoreductase domain-containing protein
MTHSSSKEKKPLGWWAEGDSPPEKGNHAIRSSILKVTQPVHLLNLNGEMGIGRGGTVTIGEAVRPEKMGFPLLAYAPPLHPESLGDPYFKKNHNLRYAYIAGAMANGITSVEMVEAMGHAGMVGFFGAAGLPLHGIEDAVVKLKQTLHHRPFGFNLINSPNEPELEAATVDLYLKHGIRLISASAYLDLTLPLVYFRVKGIRRDPEGHITCPNKIIAKVSRVEVARKFFSPPPDKLLAQLIDKKMITEEEAALSQSVPVAEDMTAEADSGGHTDNRPALSLLPTMLALRNEMAEKFKYQKPLHVGLGGGIATPDSAAAAFAMGAAYILTGSINQSCVEAGTSATVRHMLAEAGQADVTMAPAADMFEMGVKVQVLKRGTLFPFRAAKLYDLYCNFDKYEELPQKERAVLERDFFRRSFQEVWKDTKTFFESRDPRQIGMAEKDPKHKMALVFRSYLGLSSTWAKTGDPSRRIDYQIWCGPAIGAFNEWTKGSFLGKPENRKTVTVAMNLLCGAAVATRANWLRSQGIGLPPVSGAFSPMELSDILKLLDE